MRLQKYMAKCGVASRRKSEEIIESGAVKVNGKTIRKQGVKIDPKKDKVEVRGKKIELEERKVYLLLNKPKGYVTTMDDEKDRNIVMDLIKGVEERIYPVGRLDMDTSGLLLFTNDGEVTNKITHPSYEIAKKYLAIVEGKPNEEELNHFREGIVLDGRKTSPASIKVLESYNNQSKLEVEIIEGRNRQVRRMFSAIGHSVIELERVSIGEIKLGDLKLGSWRHLNTKEKNYILSL